MIRGVYRWYVRLYRGGRLVTVGVATQATLDAELRAANARTDIDRVEVETIKGD